MDTFILASCIWIALLGFLILLSTTSYTPFSTLAATTGVQEAGSDPNLYRAVGALMIAIGTLTLFCDPASPFDLSSAVRGSKSKIDSAQDADTKKELIADAVENNVRATTTLTLNHAAVAFYTYTTVVQHDIGGALKAGMSSSTFPATGICAGSSVLFFWGVLKLVFGGEQAKVSKTTGADKRTSNFPFSNKGSARSQKKEFKAKAKGN